MVQNNTESSTIIRKMFFASVGVLVFQTTSAMLGNLVDGIITSRFLGENAMASLSIASPIYSIIMMIVGVLSTGTQVAYTKIIGKGDTDRAGAVFNICFFVTLGISVLFGIIAFFAADPICMLLGARGKDALLLVGSSDYMRGVAIGFPGIFMVQVLSGFMQIDSDRNRTMIAMVVLTVVNIVGDLMNVYVFHGGMFGMAVATTVSYYAGLFILMLHFVKKDIILKISLRGLVRHDIADIVRNGLPHAISNAGMMVQKVSLNYILLAIAGIYAVSALGKYYTFFGFLNMVMVGIGNSTMLVAGVCAGEEDRDGLRYLQGLSLKFGLLVTCLISVIVLCFTPGFVHMFMKETSGEAYTAACDAFRINSFGLPFIVIDFVFIMYFQGIRNNFLSRLLSFLEKMVSIPILAVVLGNIFGVNGVWISIPLGEMIVCILIFVMALFRKRVAGSYREALMFLPAEFGPKPEDVFSFSIRSADEVVPASRAAGDFIAGHGGESRHSMMISLCIEEMIGNIIRFGFADGNKHTVESKLVHSHDGWILRIKDDCAPFDPPKWLEIQKPDDPTANIGIRMVCSMASEVRYVSTMQMNILIINV